MPDLEAIAKSFEEMDQDDKARLAAEILSQCNDDDHVLSIFANELCSRIALRLVLKLQDYLR